MHYDPMISKLVTFGEDRDSALALNAKALDQYVIQGIEHNGAFLRTLLTHPVVGEFLHELCDWFLQLLHDEYYIFWWHCVTELFTKFNKIYLLLLLWTVAGKASTDFIENEYADGFDGIVLSDAKKRLLAAVATTMHAVAPRSHADLGDMEDVICVVTVRVFSPIFFRVII